MNLRKVLFGTFATITILIASFIAFVSLKEWWTVGVNDQISGYPWGPINDNPWYYNTPELYIKTMLIEFTVLIIGLALTTYFIVKRKKEKTFYCLLGIWGFLIIIWGNGYIQ